ncbi:low temperature requirement protein A [Curtobacterium sp. S6]|uniref:low temperature requirement protein A n=1 Tax=Curtobacterium sp. S6 TaxID=1479623 RepID=UPI000AD61CB4|nr:low temperature requirement protein A [Curtobacterium sp. S6]
MHQDQTVPRSRLLPMVPRRPEEPGRVASSLELFFDLVFVVAVSTASQNLHHLMAEGHVADGLLHYGMAFFGIWWAWMNFSWFATSFDTDDWLYRVFTIVQMAGVLVLAAGLEPAFLDNNYAVLVIGYVIMRVAMVCQWLRASRCGGPAGRSARIYGLSILLVQILWIAWLLIPVGGTQLVGFVILMLAEISVPVIAEKAGGTPWHPHHITERYSLFTLIVLGESLTASTNAIIESLHGDQDFADLISIAVLALVVTAGLWWIYFWPEHHKAITTFSSSLRYGYGHYFVFAAAAAFSVGIELEIDQLGEAPALPAVAASYAVAIPVAVFLLGVWGTAYVKQSDPVVNTAVPVAACLVLLDPVLPLAVAVTAGVIVALVVVLVIRRPVAGSPAQDESN